MREPQERSYLCLLSNGLINTHHHNWIIIIIFNVNSVRLNLDPPPQLVLLRTLLSFSTVILV